MNFYFRNNTMELKIIEELQNKYIQLMELNIKNKLNKIFYTRGHIGSFTLLCNTFLVEMESNLILTNFLKFNFIGKCFFK